MSKINNYELMWILSSEDSDESIEKTINSVKDNILKIAGINDVDLKLVWDPPWTKDKMSEAAKLELNL